MEEEDAEGQLSAVHAAAVISEHANRARVCRLRDARLGVAPHGETDVDVERRDTGRELEPDTTSEEVAGDPAHLRGAVAPHQSAALSVEVEDRREPRTRLDAEESVHGGEPGKDALTAFDASEEAERTGALAMKLGCETRIQPLVERVERRFVHHAAVAGSVDEEAVQERVHLRAVGAARAFRRHVRTDLVHARREHAVPLLESCDTTSEVALTHRNDPRGADLLAVRSDGGTEHTIATGETHGSRSGRASAACADDVRTRHVMTRGAPKGAAVMGGAHERGATHALLVQTHGQSDEPRRRRSRGSGRRGRRCCGLWAVEAGGELGTQTCSFAARMVEIGRLGTTHGRSRVERLRRRLRERRAGLTLRTRRRREAASERRPVGAGDVVVTHREPVARLTRLRAKAVVLAPRIRGILPEGRRGESE